MDSGVKIIPLSRDHLTEHIGSYLEISEDVSSWTADNFLRELPGKWELSFSLWTDDLPIAYCIMSTRGNSVHIHQFMVKKDYRGAGIGGMMMEEAKRVGKATITLKVDAQNVAGRRFYERHGFEVKGEENGYLLLLHVSADQESGLLGKL